MRCRHLDNIIIEVGSMFFSGSDNSKHCSIASLDLLDIRFGLITQNSLQVQYNTRHIWTNKRERTMLQLSR